MLVIRAAQMAALSAESMRRFEERVMSHIGRCFPESMKQSGQAELLHLIRHAVKRGPKLGLQSEREIVLLIDLTILFGEDFEKAYPEAGQILANNTLSGPDKVESLLAFFNDIPDSLNPKRAC